MWQEMWRNYKKNPSAMIGLFTIALIIIVAIVAQFVYDYQIDIVQQNVPERFMAPGEGGHILGTDNFGRDELVRILYGGLE